MEAIHAACPFRHQPILDSIALVVEPLICRGFPNCYFLSGGGVTSLDPIGICDSWYGTTDGASRQFRELSRSPPLPPSSVGS